MIDRRLLLIGGFALFGLGVVELTAPGSLPIPVTDGILVLFSVGVFGYAYLVVQKRRSQGPRLSETPDVELPNLTAVPGDRLDAVLETFPGVDAVEPTSLSSIRSGLRQAAVTVLTRYGGYSESEARQSVADGSWTTDRDAGEFLRDPASGSGSDKPADRTHREQLIDRTTEAIVAVSNVAPGAEEHSSGTAPAGSPPQIPDGVEQTAIDPAESHQEPGLTPGDRRETNHWVGIGFVVLVCLGVGTLTRNPGILLGAIVGVGYAAYARSTPVGTVDLAIERSISQTEPQPGETVEVTLTVHNEGSRLLSDLRIVDGVPESLAVSEGSPRRGTVLRGGEAVTLSYTITARRGTHEFGPALALVRNLPGSVEQELYLSDPTTITCRPTIQPLQESVPLRNQATPYTGQVETDNGGTGVEFQSVREYHPGDSLTRIDWNRRARTGELTTVEFREERAATVVILVDCRRSAYVGPTETATTAVEQAVSGAERTFTRLLADGNQVGIATVGVADRWLAPGTGPSHRHEGTGLLGTVPLFESDGTIDNSETPLWNHELGRRLPETAQILVFTPLSEPRTLYDLQQFEAHGHSVTVISPEPTAERTASQRLARLRRSVTVTDLRQSGIPVFDWAWTQPLETVLTNRAVRR
ncbi:DUF58 domain-containing protein [Halobacteriaceae bacterium SHR40]|uniref:DUF58 domain-containing protein n=1 Tax=Halovenus amylolytica TaxID=2500550 RepID=UPI000FE43359